MKYLKAILLLPLMLMAQPVLADDSPMIPADVMNYIGYGAIVLMLVLIVVVMLVLLRTFKVLTRVVLRSEGYTADQIAAELAPVKKVRKPREEVWQKLLSLRPMAEEKELLLPDEYDGIQELDNPTPGWFMGLFYTTILFAVCYFGVYQVFGLGQNQYEEYNTEMANAAAAKKEYLSKAANRVDENTVKLVSDPAVLASGKTVFMATCVPCHGEHAQGVIGPNLTDDYWLHGGKINEVFKTIKYGVNGKGMPTWEKQLSPKQISDVANYVKSLHGTNPANAKAPQGEKEGD